MNHQSLTTPLKPVGFVVIYGQSRSLDAMHILKAAEDGLHLGVLALALNPMLPSK
jgi:hypothetical protein